MTNPGSGYVPPLSVVVAPGEGTLPVIPIWGAAGSLSTDLVDMGRFAAAALGHRYIGRIPVPADVMLGFQIAETAYACTGADPSLAACPQDETRSALTWSIKPADTANRYPALILKDGSLPGFTTQVFLVPARDLAIVVFVNARQTATTGENGLTATEIGSNILNALLYTPGVH